MKRQFSYLLALVSLLIAQTEPVKDIHRNDPRVWALTNAMIHTEPGDSIKNGTVVIRDGKIEKVGRYIKVPLDAYEIDLEGSHIYAGFIDGWFQVKKDEQFKLGSSIQIDFVTLLLSTYCAMILLSWAVLIIHRSWCRCSKQMSAHCLFIIYK